MNGKLLYVVFFIFFVGLKTSAQLTTSLESNSQWYIDDEKIKLSPEDAKERLRSNNYLRLDYYTGNWSFGTQIESYEPISLLNYNPELEGTNIGTVYAKYKFEKINLEITAGHFYEQFGSGLVFRTWENRQLGINNAMFGGRIKYKPIQPIELTILGGKQRIGMGFDLSEGVIYAANLETDISSLFKIKNHALGIGLSYVGRYEEDKYPRSPDLLSTYSGRVSYGVGNFYAEAEYVKKDKDLLVEVGSVIEKVKEPGDALRLNLGYTEKGLGIDVNLRRIENLWLYSQQNLAGNDYTQGTLNYIPALTKQYDYSLQNIYVYQAQPQLIYFGKFKAGEIGGQIDLFYEFKRKTALGGKYGTKLAFNTSHFWGLKAEKEAGNTYNSTYFATGEKYYSDYGLELRKKWSKNWSSIFMYLNQYYNTILEDRDEIVNAHTLAAESTYKLGGGKSVRLELQHQWADAYHKNWVGAMVEYNINYNWSVFVFDMYNYGNTDENKRIHYYNAGISYTKKSTRIAVQYGRQRGGLLCVGGICRMVSEAAGLTVNITTSF